MSVINTSSTMETERIASLDVLRGFAVLGILLMNIQSFSMPSTAYINPTTYGDLSGINCWAWIFSHLLADTKFMSIFSMLFGAGVCLFADRALAKTGKSTFIHYRRLFWLLIFGLLHAYFIWHGDILVAYALCGSLVYLFRNRQPKTLLLLGLMFMSVASLYYFFVGFSLPHLPPDAIADISKSWQPAAETIAKEISNFQGGWSEQNLSRFSEAVFLETFVFAINIFWRATGMMLLGMALYKWGVMNASRDKQFYQKLVVICGVVGLLLVAFGIQQNFANRWSLEYSFFLGTQYNYWGSVLVALAYIGMIMLMVKINFLKGLQARLAAVGRMAFTNYILQSVICTFIMYGHGLGYFGEVERWQQLMIVSGVWALQLFYSPIWLKHYRFGPLEWCWRVLTYMKRQPFKTAKA